jgi:transposase-like protein
MSETHCPDLSFAERWRRSQDEVSRLRAENMSEPVTPDAAAPPARCPVCRSQDVKTTSKVASVDAYWRCAACGEVWNVGRHRAGSRYARDLPFRR